MKGLRGAPKLAVVGVAIAVVVAGGVAVAASTSGVIHGCASKRDGALRLAPHCKHNERAVSWNSTGASGPRGATGPKGQLGVAGSPGQQGAPGSPAASVFSARFSLGSSASPQFGPVSGMSSGNANESMFTQPSPAATIVARDLFATFASDTGTPGSTRTFTLRVNGADSALTCTYTIPVTSCSDTADQVTIPPGSQLTIESIQGGASISAGNVLVAWRATTP